MTALIRVTDVHRVYGEGDAEVRALDGVDLAVDSGEFVALMGPSGSGKSTMLNVLGVLDVPTSGSYRFRGVEVTELDNDQRALLRRHYLGFVFQGFNLLPRSTALENVELPLVYRGLSRSVRRRKAAEALAAVDLADRGHHLPGEMSGGQQQRVAIARSIVTEPDVLLADEPTGNLDTKMSHDILAILAGLNDRLGISVVMVTHEPEMAAYADRLVTFRDGRVERDGDASVLQVMS